eukprot:gene7852-biopygen7583
MPAESPEKNIRAPLWILPAPARLFASSQEVKTPKKRRRRNDGRTAACQRASRRGLAAGSAPAGVWRLQYGPPVHVCVISEQDNTCHIEEGTCPRLPRPASAVRQL